VANAILQKFDAWVDITITLTALAAAAGRGSTVIANASNRGRSKVLLSVKPTSAPTAETLVDCFLLEQDDSAATTGRTDLWTAADAALTPLNAKNLGSLVTDGTTNNMVDVFETTFVATLNANGWGIVVRNGMNVAFSGTAADCKKRQQYFFDEIQ
jgi:hypothetical protein